jgi:ankyrin repeat protein
MIDILQNNCLHYSLKSSKGCQVIKSIIAKIKDIDKPNKIGLTPLMLAALQGDPRILERLLANRPDISKTNE